MTNHNLVTASFLLLKYLFSKSLFSKIVCDYDYIDTDLISFTISLYLEPALRSNYNDNRSKSLQFTIQQVAYFYHEKPSY